MTTFGVTPQGFVLKRLADILADMQAALAGVQGPVTGESDSEPDGRERPAGPGGERRR